MDLINDKKISAITWNILSQKVWHQEYSPVNIKDFPEERRLKMIIEQLKAGDYDIICLQEVEISLVNNILNSFTEYEHIAHEIITKGKNKRTNSFGNMTMWRSSMFTSKQLPTNSCGVSVELTHHNTTFVLVNVHLRAGLKTQVDARVCEIKSRLNYLNSYHKDIPTIITGDYNDDILADSLLRIPLIHSNFEIPIPDQSEATCYIHKVGHARDIFDHVASR